MHIHFSDKLYAFTFNPPTWVFEVWWQKKSIGFCGSRGLSFHFSDTNFRPAVFISFKTQLQQNTYSTMIRLWGCVYGHAHGSWALTFHFSDIKFCVSGLILLTGTELLQKCTKVRQVSEFHVGDRKLRDTFFFTYIPCQYWQLWFENGSVPCSWTTAP